MKTKVIKFFVILLLIVVVVSSLVISSSAAPAFYFTLSGSTDFIVLTGDSYDLRREYTYGAYDLPFSFYNYDILTYYYENMGQYLLDTFDINLYDYVPVVIISDTTIDDTEFGYFYSADHSNNIDLFNDWNLEHEFIAVTVLDDNSVDNAVPWGNPVIVTGTDVALDHSRYSLFLLPLSSRFVQNSPYIDVLERATYNDFNQSLFGLSYNAIGDLMFDDLDNITSTEHLVLNLICGVIWVLVLLFPVVIIYLVLRFIC